MDYETLDVAILAGAAGQWSTGRRIDVLDGDNEKSYFVKVIEREEFVDMAEAEYEGQKAIAAVIPDNAVKPVAWGYSADTKSKGLVSGRLLPIIKQMHQRSISPTGQFGFHVTSYYGPQPMIVDWTDNWEESWVREFRSGLRYVERMRGHDPELFKISEQFIEKVASRFLRPLQTGGRSIKPSLCHGNLCDENIQFNVDTHQPVIFDPCSFYGHHEMDFQCMKGPQCIIGQNFIDLYKVKVGASKPIEDFEDRVSLYAMAKADMRRLLEKYPDGLRYYMGGLEPTIASLPDTPPATPSRAQPSTQIASKGDNTGINTPPRTPLITYDPSRNSITDDILGAGE
ncbi:Ketosamine-3-kinase [Beauveria bassiana]|uniref:protein-ribulosamine 3-kinase n=1 Tax=Beauveria bassiana TaxID=176275 RepID=A0A2N6NFE7_BEABA|nr:Ketosamine-3-kinase [Beauveria bassiana]